MRDASLLDEGSVRAQLVEIGLTGSTIDDQIRRARTLRAVHAQMETTWERTTAIGYMNEHGQEVVRKTASPGTLVDQRLYALRCSACGAEYGVNGSDIHRSRCPSCDGALQD